MPYGVWASVVECGVARSMTVADHGYALCLEHRSPQPEGPLQRGRTSPVHAKFPPPLAFSTVLWCRQPWGTTPSTFLPMVLAVSHSVVQEQLKSACQSRK